MAPPFIHGPLTNNPVVFLSELAFTIVLIMLCLVIYFKTKELFGLTRYKGIDYFRKTFLFLAISYLFKFISTAIMLSTINSGFPMQRSPLVPISLMLVSYFSTMAIIYLFLSFSWKNIKLKYISLFAPVLAALISVFAFISRESLIVVSCQALLLLFAGIFSHAVHKKSKEFSKLFAIYILLSIFWLIGLVQLSPRRFFPPGLNFIAQLISFIILIAIYYKVNKWVK